MAAAMNFHKLKAEVATWVDEKIISTSQAEQILARYSATVPAYKRMSFWLQCLAATLAGLALLLVISKNWQHLNWFAQSSITLVPLIAAQLWAVLQERKGNHLGAELGWFLASLALGANIMIQAQIFHISAYYPNGVLFWVMGILPILIFRGSHINYLLAALLFFVYLVMQLDHHQFSVLSFLPLGTLAWFAWSLQRVTTLVPLLVIIYMFLLTILAHWQMGSTGINWELAMILFSVALIQQFTRITGDWARRLLYLSFGFTAFINILLTFRFFAHEATKYSASVAAWVMAAVAIASIALYRRSLREPQLTWLTVANIAATVVTLLAQRALPVTEGHEGYYLVRIAANIVYLGSVAVLLFRAIAIREKPLFMAAVMAFLLWTLIRYIDLFSNYLITALIFALSAVALVLLNKLWEKKYEN